MEKHPIKIVIIDLWQTLADIPRKPLSEIYQLSQSELNLEQFISDFKKSEVFTTDKPIEDTLTSFLSKYPETTNYDRCIQEWKKIASEAFLIKDAQDFINKIKEKYQLVLCTDIDTYGYENFKFKEIFDCFSIKFRSYKVGKVKSQIEFWNLLSNHYSSIPPESILVIGDSFSDDIKNPKSLGFQTFQIGVDGDLADVYSLLIK